MSTIIDGVEVSVIGGAIRWTSHMNICADGSPRAYHPNSALGLDNLANAQSKDGRWVGVVTNSAGQPIVQGADDIAPGYYVSPTALTDRRYGERDPKRYVNAELVPYVVLPPDLERLGARLGDVALVRYGGQTCAAVCAEVGPHGHLGEGSVALALQLRINPDARRGGCSSGVSYVVYCGTSRGWPRTNADIAQQVAGLQVAVA